MSNSTMNQINVTNPIIYRLDSSNYMVNFDVTTGTHTSALIDMSNILENDIKIISSNAIYSKFKQIVSNRTNKNIGSIKFYSYCGGKEITRMVTNSNKMSNIPYPPYTGTLFSSIILPELNDNDTVYLILDEYKDIETITCPLIKMKLISRDLSILFENIRLSILGKNIKFTVIYENTLYEELNKSYSNITSLMKDYDINFNANFKTHNVVCNYVCDLVFGRVFGGKTQEFTGVINPESFTIIDVFCSNANSVHTFTNRTSGLSISGNGTSTIFILMKCTTEIESDLKITEIVTGKELLNINLSSNIKVHKNSGILLKLINLYNYDLRLENILKDDETKIKEFIKENLEEIFDIEFNFLDNYNEKDLEEDIRSSLNSSIMIIYNRIITNLENVRKIFTNKRKSDFDDNINYVQREYSVFSTPGLAAIANGNFGKLKTAPIQSGNQQLKVSRYNNEYSSLPPASPLNYMDRYTSDMSIKESW